MTVDFRYLAVYDDLTAGTLSDVRLCGRRCDSCKYETISLTSGAALTAVGVRWFVFA